MAAKTMLHSGAFNFLSFIDNSVDPRTGQYSLSIALPELRSHYLGGVNYPLRLTYSSMGAGDFGYGEGWDINLSSFIEQAYPEGGALALYNGERFTVDGVDSISEKKLDTFHFHKDADGLFRVEHKDSKLTEVLENMGVDARRMALPTKVYADSRRWLEFRYIDHPQLPGQKCLHQVLEGRPEGQPPYRLLLIEYPGDMVITLYPDHAEARASYWLKFKGRRLERVELPTDEKAYWEFSYQEVHGQTCVNRVRSPAGGVEHIAYGKDGDPGHKLPNVDQYLPRVKEHRVVPGAGQAEHITTYDYSSTNFVGNGSSITWNNNGRDQLYEVTEATYTYWSKTTESCPGQADRTVLRTYDRFHRITEEKTVQDGKERRTVTAYPGNSTDPFRLQPKHFQLPSLSTQIWQIEGKQEHGKAEHATEYDEFGNLIKEVAATGVETSYVFYPAAGEIDKCPADPQGFKRWCKNQTIKPSASGEGAAATEHTEFVYTSLRPVPLPEGTPEYVIKDWIVPIEEHLFVLEGAQKLPQRQTMTGYHEPEDGEPIVDLLSYGRPRETTMKMGGKDTVTTYSYTTEVVERHPALVTEHLVKGFDDGHALEEDGTVRHVQKAFTLKHSALIGEPLLNRDDNDVEIAYAYDRLARVISETVAPNEPAYRASRNYSYVLAVGENPAVQTSTDVKGVTTRSLLDGLGRVFEEWRMEADSTQVWRQEDYRKTYAASYNAYGQLAEETEIDWMADEVTGLWSHKPVDLLLRREYGYDAWGQQAWERGPDGITHFEETDPIGNAQSAWLPIQRSWRESEDGSVESGLTETYQNRFEQPTQVNRYKKRGDTTAYSQHAYFYDGLGRVSREVAADKSTTLNTYDVFGRLLTQTLPDRSVVTRSYAAFDSGDLPESIDVNGTLLGTQTFDGLKRLYRSVTGGRKRLLYFKPGHNQPEKVFTPSKQWVEYEYNPVLGEEPLKRKSSRFTADYEYDPENARMLSCTEDRQTLKREYFSTGQLKSETRIEEGEPEPFEMLYAFSFRGRMLSYTDVLKQVQSYEYDAVGRLYTTLLGTTVATFKYDKLGRTREIETRDGDNYLVTTLEYDEFDRETLRHFDMKGDVQTLKQDYDVCDRIEEKTLKSGDQETGELLRQETYAYDARGRLYDYQCSGPLSPVDPQGHVIRSQAFEFDAIDNIILVITGLTDKNTGDPGENVAEYLFEYDDPAQLSQITNTYEGYAPVVILVYDDDGNLINDGEGMLMDYDATGRLRSVDKGGVASNYYYDGVDRLSGQS